MPIRLGQERFSMWAGIQSLFLLDAHQFHLRGELGTATRTWSRASRGQSERDTALREGRLWPRPSSIAPLASTPVGNELVLPGLPTRVPLLACCVLYAEASRVRLEVELLGPVASGDLDARGPSLMVTAVEPELRPLTILASPHGPPPSLGTVDALCVLPAVFSEPGLYLVRATLDGAASVSLPLAVRTPLP